MDETRNRGELRALVLATLAFAVCFAVWGLIAPLAPRFRELYGLSTTEVGLLVAVPVLLGSIARVPLGMLTDQYGGRVVFSVLMALLLVPLVVTGLSGSFGSLLLAALFLGLSGASFAIGIPFVAGWFPPARQGLALGVYGAGNIGTAAAAIVAPRVADAYGWPWAFWLFLPVVAAMAALFWVAGRNAPGFRPQRASIGARLSVLRVRPVSWILILFYFVTFGGFVAIGAFLPSFLVSEYGLTPTDAGSRTAGFVVLATAARPLGGYLSDRFRGSMVLSGVFLTISLFAIVLAFQPGMIGITVGFLGCAFALGVGNGAVFKLVAELFPGQTGTVGGLVGAAGGLGGFFPPLVMGAVRDITGTYAIGFMLLSEFALGCLIVNLLALQRGAWRLMEGAERSAA